MINYAHPQFATTQFFKSPFESSNIAAKARFDKAGLRGAFGNKPKRDRKPKYVPGQGGGIATATNRAVMFRGRHEGDEHRMVVYTDGSLRHEKGSK